MTPTKTPRERIQEIMFATCPVDIQEPFFWKWNEHGLNMLEAFYNALLEEARQEGREEMKKKLNTAINNYVDSAGGWGLSGYETVFVEELQSILSL